MQVHDQVVGLGVPVPDLALVAVRVPGHLVRHVAILTVTGQKLVVLGRSVEAVELQSTLDYGCPG